MDPESDAGYSPWRFASAKGGTFSGGWFPTTPPAWRVGNEIRAPDTLVDANPTRLRTWVRFPPSPSGPESRLVERLSAVQATISLAARLPEPQGLTPQPWTIAKPTRRAMLRLPAASVA